jgi:ornithine cyclodeaminase/alanine dehydrogenase-like protein (mu-crystallin family)
MKPEEMLDSTGIALEDAVAAVVVYEKARDMGTAAKFNFAA